MRPWTLALIVLTACGDNTDDTTGHPHKSDDTATGDTGDTGHTGGGDDTSPPVFRPTNGHWTYLTGAIINDTCQADLGDIPGGEGDGYMLTMRGEGLFTVLLDGSGDSYDCTLDDRAYVCEHLESADPVDDYDIMIHTSLDVTGLFDDETHTTDHFTLGVDCSGSDCDLAEWYYDMSFPCQVVFDAASALQ